MRGETTMFIEIPVTVYFNYSPGEPICQSDPGCPEEVEYIGFDTKKAIDDLEWKIKEDVTFEQMCLFVIRKAERENTPYMRGKI